MDMSTRIKFDDSVFPSGAGDVTLYDTVAAFPGQHFWQAGGVKKFVGNTLTDQAGTIRIDTSNDRGVNWHVQGTPIAVVTGGAFDFEFLVEHYDDFRVVFTNGGVDQTVWHVNLALSNERAHSKNGANFH